MFGFGKKKFDSSLLIPKDGIISGMFFSNPNVGIDTNIFYQIQIDLFPFKYESEEEITNIQLNFIFLPVKSYIELKDQNYHFPVNPAEGYIDGSIYISGMHNPFDVTKIVFGPIDEQGIGTTFSANLIFEDDSVKPTDIELSTKLLFGDIEIHCDKLNSMEEKEMLDYAFKNIDPNVFRYNADSTKFEWKR